MNLRTLLELCFDRFDLFLKWNSDLGSMIVARFFSTLNSNLNTNGLTWQPNPIIACFETN